MKILVCISIVPDTTTKVKFKGKTEFDKTGVQWIINPWDELALTRAIELKEKKSGTIEKITVINVGKSENDAVIRKALAIGADEAVRIDTEAKDAFSVASELANAVKNIEADIILTGLESSDYNGSAVGGMLSQLLDIQGIAAVSGIDIIDKKVQIKQEIDGGYEKLHVNTPFVATVQKGIAIDPRIANMRGIMMAKRKPLKVLQPINPQQLTEFVEYEMPKPKPPVKIVENAQQLVEHLHNQAKVI